MRPFAPTSSTRRSRPTSTPGPTSAPVKDVVIDATSTDTPQAFAAGLGLGVAAVSAAATAVALNENTWAFINGATVQADANVLLSADSTSSYDPLAATGSLGLIGGIGVSGTLFYKAENAQAYITGGAERRRAGPGRRRHRRHGDRDATESPTRARSAACRSRRPTSTASSRIAGRGRGRRWSPPCKARESPRSSTTT